MDISTIDIAKLPHSAQEAIEAAEKGDSLYALIFLERAIRKRNDPLLRSYYGYCLARERQEIKKAVQFCRLAVEENPRDPVLYLNLGRVLLAGGMKGQAIRAFRKGLKFGREARIIQLLQKMGTRKPPLFLTLPREHPLNKLMGRILSRIGMR